jgi:hypothetical protein
MPKIVALFFQTLSPHGAAGFFSVAEPQLNSIVASEARELSSYANAIDFSKPG